MKQLPLPILDETLCTGCGTCVRICPVDCLAMGDFFPWLARPQQCLSCSACVLVCPVGALSLDASGTTAKPGA